MPKEEIALVVDGRPYTEWKGLRVYQSLRQMAGRFTVQAEVERDRFLPDEFFGQRVSITANGDPIMAGYLEGYEADSFAREIRSASLVGRSVLTDLATGTSDYFELKNTTPIALIERAAQPFGVEIINNIGAGPNIDTYRVNPGQKAYQVIEDGLFRWMREAHATEDREGRLELFQGSRGQHPGASTKDVKRIRVSIDGSRLYSDYVVYSPSQANTPSAVIAGNRPIAEPVATFAGDSAFGDRHRPIRIHPKGPITEAEAQIYAERYARRSRGQGFRVHLSFQGWRAARGQLWELGYTLPINIPQEGINQDMIITEIVFEQAGTSSTITLEPPDAFLSDIQSAAPRGAPAIKPNPTATRPSGRFPEYRAII